MGITIKKRRKT
jgi:hypothetical protein